MQARQLKDHPTGPFSIGIYNPVIIVKKAECAFNESRYVCLDFVVTTAFEGNAFGLDQVIELAPSHLGNVDSLKLFPVGVEKNHLGALSWYLLESGALVLGLKVLEDEVLHLGELVESSSSAGLDPAGMNGRIFSISLGGSKGSNGVTCN